MKICDLNADINLQWILVGVIVVVAIVYAVVALLRATRHKGKKKSCDNCGACGLHGIINEATHQEQDGKGDVQDQSTKGE